MKTTKIGRISLAQRPPRPTFAPAFKGQMPFLGHVAMALKSLRGVKEITVDKVAWKKLNDTMRPDFIDLFKNVDLFLISHHFLDLGLKVYRVPQNAGLIYIMGEPENMAMIDRINPHDDPKLAIRRSSSLIDGRHNS
jgi:hypothetical protein